MRVPGIDYVPLAMPVGGEMAGRRSQSRRH
jgi:hypothetical protein